MKFDAGVSVFGEELGNLTCTTDAPTVAAGFRKTRHRGMARVGWMFTLTATAYNLVRLPKLAGAVA